MSPHTPIGVSTWVWCSPLTDERLDELAPRIADWGFDVIELPVEQPGDWDPSRTRDLLDRLGLDAAVCAVMTPERDLTTADSGVVGATRGYLRDCVGTAVTVGADTVAGPVYAPTGATPRLSTGERATALERAAEGLRPVTEHAAQRDVTIAVEPLNRYETSLINTVDQALELIDAVDSPGIGVLLDTFHLNIEERDPAAAARAAGGHIAHLQASATHRGQPGDDHLDWEAFRDAVTAAGYDGPWCIESFTPDNEAIARAASIWRDLADTQDAIATGGLAHLRRLLG